MLGKCILTISMVWMFQSSLTHAGIVELRCQRLSNTLLADELWSFDFDLQILTLTDSVYETGEPPFYIKVQRAIQIWTRLNSAGTQFTVIQHIENQTGTALTGFTSYMGGTVATVNNIVDGSAWATESSEVHYLSPLKVEFSWSEPIPPGESFTTGYDIYVPFFNEPSSPHVFTLFKTVVPEPATTLLFGLGGLVLLGNRRYLAARGLGGV